MEKDCSYGSHETQGENSSTGQVRWSSSPLDPSVTNKGIEERFSNALGLPREPYSVDNGILGFTLEGNRIYYVIMLALVIIGTVLIYLKYKV